MTLASNPIPHPEEGRAGVVVGSQGGVLEYSTRRAGSQLLISEASAALCTGLGDL